VVRSEELAKQQRDEARTYVHASGALSDRVGAGGAAARRGRNQPGANSGASRVCTCREISIYVCLFVGLRVLGVRG